MNYHSQEAFASRMGQRQARSRPLFPHAVFYHIACLNHWRDVVREQCRLFAHVGLKEVRACVVGDGLDESPVIAAQCGVNLIVHGHDPDVRRFEGITLDAVHDWSKDHPDGAITYVHTKGVSAAGDRNKERWRRIMAREVVAEWQRNLKLLELADIAGCCWQESPHHPHFSGNFWAARCDWLMRLERPSSYRVSRPDFPWGGSTWRERFYAETWLGSQCWHHVESFHHGRQPWNDDVFSMPFEVDGFSYEDKP